MACIYPDGHRCVRAGKDVYVEKPLTLTIDEGRLLCKVVEETKRLVQVGTWQRSDVRFRRACELVQSGLLGQVAGSGFRLNYLLASCLCGYEDLKHILPELRKTGAEAIDLSAQGTWLTAWVHVRTRRGSRPLV